MDDHITKIEKINKNKFSIYINDEQAFSLYYSDIKKCGLYEDAVFDEALSEKVQEILYERGLKRALFLVRSKEQTSYDLKKKLSASGYPESTVQKILKKLTGEGLVDDRRFARMYIEIYGEKKPALLIKNDLRKKGIDRDIVDELYEEITGDDPDNELKQCVRLLEAKYPASKFSQITESDDEKLKYDLKNKAMAFLARKGFSFDAVSESVKEHFDI